MILSIEGKNILYSYSCVTQYRQELDDNSSSLKLMVCVVDV